MLTAADKILRKALIGSNIDSRDWNTIQAGMRDRAFFSSKVAEVNILDAARKFSSEYADGHYDLSKIRMSMRDFLTKTGYQPNEGEEGTIKDLFSKARLDVIIKHNVDSARGFIQYAEAMTPGAYAAFPAREFKRVKSRNVERKTWHQRWEAAGGKEYGGRMIALKDDPVWTKLSVFGTPYPPFDWGSGMGVVNIGLKEAIDLGLITKDEVKDKVSKLREERERGESPSVTGNLQAKIPLLNGKEVGDMRATFGKTFGDLVRVDGDVVKWRPEVLKETFRTENFSIRLGEPDIGLITKLAANKETARFVEEIRGKQLTVTQDWRDTKRPDGSNHLTHFNPEPDKPDNVPLTEEELEMLPAMWHNPTRVVPLTGERFQIELEAIDGATYCLQIATHKKGGKPLTGPQVWSFFKTRSPLSKRRKKPDHVLSHPGEA